MAFKLNLKSILKKIEKAINKKETQEKIIDIEETAFMGGEQPINGHIHTADEVCEKFRDVLIDSIMSSGVSGNVSDAIINSLNHISVEHIGNGEFEITVGFDDSVSRESLDPFWYIEIKDLGALYNYGVDHEMKPVYGYWHNKKTKSRTEIPRYGYYEDAVSTFMSNYADEYNVIGININNAIW